jgi:hypothetical protein
MFQAFLFVVSLLVLQLFIPDDLFTYQDGEK